MALRSPSYDSLRSQLSSNASLLLPSNGETFTNAAGRWSSWNTPGVAAVVQAVTANDVVVTVAYAQSVNQSFLVQNQGHGWTNFSDTQNAIIIRIDGMKSLDIDSEANTLTVGPGLDFEELANALYSAGKEMTIGTCNCVGFLGAALGGGHGRLQGLHGLLADSLLSAKVLLADGSVAEAKPEGQYSDLFYALGGAGHNFGVVLEASFRVYNQSNGGMHYDAAGFYTRDQALALFQATNAFHDQQPAGVSIYTVLTYANNAPLFIIDFVYAGPAEEGRALFDKAYGNIPRASFTEDSYPWNDLNNKSIGGHNTMCQNRGMRKSMFNAGLLQFDNSTINLIVDEYATFMAANPSAVGSFYLFESYPLQAVRNRDQNALAYANRDVNHIIMLEIIYPNSSLDAVAEEYGQRQRAILNSRSGFEKPRVYVNYGHGDEAPSDMYGHEDWRMDKLKALKKKYDPHGAFSHFHPIPLD